MPVQLAASCFAMAAFAIVFLPRLAATRLPRYKSSPFTAAGRP